MSARIHGTLLALALLLFGPALIAETFHVEIFGSDRAGGTEKDPFRTIARGLDRARPGDVVLVGKGEWEGPVIVKKSGTRSRRITLRGGEGSVMGSPAIEIRGASWVTVEGFTVKGGITVSGNPQGVVLRGNSVQGTPIGIHLGNARESLVERNRVSLCDEGITVAGTGITVRNNVVVENRRAGIVLGSIRPAVHCLVRNNTMDGNGVSGDSAGGLWLRFASDATVENNILSAGPGRRLFTAEFSGGPPRFSNNHYFSPNGDRGAPFCFDGVPRTGIFSLQLLTRDPEARFADPLFADRSRALRRRSPAIDSSSAPPFPGEADISGNPRKAGFGVDAGASEAPFPSGLRRVGSQLVCGDRVVRLRGAGVGDPILNHGYQPPPDYETLRRNWNANSVRISIHPYVWRQASIYGGRERIIALMRAEIQRAIEAGLFVVLDWHITGWPDGFARPSDPGEPPGLHDPEFSLACDFWSHASAAFGKNGAVAFELWNEPVSGPNDWQPNPEEWKQLRPYWDRLVAIIRSHSDNLIILASGSWAYSLKGIREFPPADANVAFSWHVYAGKENNDEVRWADAFDDLSREHPVIVSEWGFAENGAPWYRGGVEDFGAKFASSWLEGRGLHWMAWCFSDEIGPPMLQHDRQTPTSFGGFVKNLLRLNPSPAAPRTRLSFVPPSLPAPLRPDFESPSFPASKISSGSRPEVSWQHE